MKMTKLLAGDKINVRLRWWKMPIGKYEYRHEEGRVMLEPDMRPESCRPGAPLNFYGKCVCGECQTDYEIREVEIDKITYFADNSTEATVLDEFDNRYQVMLDVPRGDVCF